MLATIADLEQAREHERRERDREAHEREHYRERLHAFARFLTQRSMTERFQTGPIASTT